MEVLKVCVRRLLISKDADDRQAMLEEAENNIGNAVLDEQLAKVVDREKIQTSGSMVSVSPELYRDLELDKLLIPSLNKTRMHGGRLLFRLLLERPTKDVAVLRARQASLRLLEARADSQVVRQALDDMAATEEDVLWMYRYRDDEALQTLYNAAFFQMWALRGLNGSPLALTGVNLHQMVFSPLIGVLTPVVYFIVPYIVLRAKLGLRLPFRTYVWMLFKSMGGVTASLLGGGGGSSGSSVLIKYASCALSMVFYLQSIFTSFQVSSTLRKVCGSLSVRVERVARFFRAADALRDALKLDAAADADMDGARMLVGSWFPDVVMGDERRVVMRPPRSRKGLCFGSALHAFKTFDYASATDSLRCAYALDALLSIPRARADIGASWADFVTPVGSRAVLDMRGLVHPTLSKNGIPNDWDLSKSNALVTGPNAGGKSTLLKATLVAVLMSQTLTVAPCVVGCRITPFSYVSSHINVPDSAGHESLFEAEMHRAKRNLDALATLASGCQALVVMDEIFSSTNPVEGIAGAFAVARRLAAHPGALCIISTHYTYLCKLERDTGGAFLNFRMPVCEGADRYKLMRGFSRQYVALELLRRSGFDDELVSDAIEVKRNLLLPPKRSRRSRKPKVQQQSL